MTRFTTSTAALAATCIEHNVTGCATCNKVVGECDFGSCQSKATTTVTYLNADGNIGETRPCCADDVTFMRQGAPYGCAPQN